MKRVLLAGGVLISLLGSAPTRAQFVWTGLGTSGLTDLAANWTANAPLVGSPTQDLLFDDFAGTATVRLPASLALRDLTFTSSTDLTLTFRAHDTPTSLTLHGDFSVGPGYVVEFQNSIATELAAASHQIGVGLGAVLRFEGPLSGLGQLIKEADGQLQLTGINTFSGGTIIRRGQILLDGGSISHPLADLIVGEADSDQGSLFLSNGATLSTRHGRIGLSVNSTGTVSMDASTWTNAQELSVGHAGTGTLILTGGSSLTTADLILGKLASGYGGVTIHGTGTTVTATGTFAVGLEGSGDLTVSNGATLMTDGAIVGESSSGDGSVAVTGAGSHWTNTGTLTIGGTAGGDGYVNLSAGGLLTSTTTILGASEGAWGELWLADSGTEWNNAGALTLGEAGSGDLFIELGADATTGSATLGATTAGDGYVQLHGAGSTWDIAGALVVGQAGDGDIYISDGALLTSTGTATLGAEAGSYGEIDVWTDGTWTHTGDVVFGAGGSGYFEVHEATASTGAATLGKLAGSYGEAWVWQTGEWDLGGNLVVGDAGEARVYLESGGVLNVAGGTGTITLAQSLGSFGTLHLGDYDAPGTLNAAAITTGAGTGKIEFATNANASSPYYFTRDGLANGTPVTIHGPTRVYHESGYTVLTGDSDYTGDTYIDGGTLVAGGATGLHRAFGTGTVTVDFGATLATTSTAHVFNPLILLAHSRLAGFGSYSTATIQDQAVLTPGLPHDRIGALEFFDLTLGGNGVLELDVRFNGTFEYDTVYVSTPATLHITATAAQPFTVRLNSLVDATTPGMLTGLTEGQSYTLGFLSADGIDGDFILGTNLLIDPSGFHTEFPGLTFTLDRTGNTFAFTFTPVPEPSTYALLGAGLLTLAGSALRRRARR